jgi:hypothetical protein
MKKARHAGELAPSKKRYVIEDAHDHPTLKDGQVVVLVEGPKLENMLIRVSDMTAHHLWDRCQQYVHLRPEKATDEAEDKTDDKTP